MFNKRACRRNPLDELYVINHAVQFGKFVRFDDGDIIKPSKVLRPALVTPLIFTSSCHTSYSEPLLTFIIVKPITIDQSSFVIIAQHYLIFFQLFT